MPLKEEGVQYPREVPPPFGLPPGWRAIEQAYGPNAKTAGQTYIRFSSPDNKHKAIGSVKSTIIKDAEDRGLDPDAEVFKWERAVSDEKEAKQREREENGFMEGEALENAQQCFRAAYGALEGYTVCAIPGWRGESKILENCGQNAAMYYSPTGWRYPLLKNIEAFFGRRMLAGLEIPDIEEARASVKLDEFGKPINVARKENIQESFTHVVEREKHKKRKHSKAFLKETDVADEDFKENDILSVMLLMPSTKLDALETHGVTNASEVNSETKAIHEILLKRGFAESTQLMYVTGKKESIEGSTDLLDHLSGIYYQRPGDFNDRPCFQKIFRSQKTDSGVACDSLHLFWSAERKCWILGKLDENLAGLARCFDNAPRPSDLTTKWRVFEAGEVGVQEN